MTYQLFPTTGFHRPHADRPGAFEEPDFARLADGGVVAVSTHAHRPDPDGPLVRDLVAHRYAPDGSLVGAQTLAESVSSPAGRAVEVTGLADGGFAVAFRPDASDYLELRSFHADGTLRGAEQVSVPGADRTALPGSLTLLDSGTLALSFAASDITPTGPISSRIETAAFTQIFDADATPISEPNRISPWVEVESFQSHIPRTTQVHDSVALGDGGYALILRVGSETPGGIEGREQLVAMQLFDATGTARGPAVPVASPENHDGRIPHAAALADGSFVVVWTNEVSGDDNEVWWRRYDPEGAPMGEAVQVAPDEGSFSLSSTRQMVTVNPTEDGGFFIIGQRHGDSEARYLQRHDADGQPVGSLDNTLRGIQEDHFSRILGGPIKVFDMGEDGYLGLMGTAGRNTEGPETVLMDDGFSARLYAPDVLGTPGDDELQAGDTGTVLFGFAGDDTLIGGSGRDTLVGGSGDDVLDGGGGINTAVFDGRERDFTVETDPGTGITTVTDDREGSPLGSNTLTNVNFLQFTDTTVTLEEPDVVALSGQVSDRDGAAMEGVTVTFTPDGAPPPVTAPATGADGSFALEVEPGTGGALQAAAPWTAQAPTITTGSALEALRMAVGLNPSWGEASGHDFIAADIDGDGRVTTADALEILRVAVGLPSQADPRWVFVDSAADLSHLSRTDTALEPGIALPPPDSDMTDLALTGIAVGHVQEYIA